MSRDGTGTGRNVVVVVARSAVDAGRDHVDPLVRTAARLLTGRDPGPTEVVRRAGRRPILSTADRPTHVSVSHSGALTAVAVSRSPVGVDIEQLRPIADAHRIARHLAGCLDDLGARTGSHDLIRGWTRYEAVTKALGCGLTIAPEELLIDRTGTVRWRGVALPLTVWSTWLDPPVGDRAGPPLAVSVATRPCGRTSVVTAPPPLSSTPPLD
ncbi:hypothetical protein PlfCFBP13513_19055 [Plantibacter flavus]|uniref:4'-phosphopantetheinyl transferase family protein n=1 Tax=Plantibacter flavus TaxID=150123 RepID=UPI0010C18165|nr:4'-phosphopantetheinyl transferase superfamily protein [Plantibacter flavus]TKJ95882.1 hypothetical protein PlfCFBP13513_19055 [Plantibacter flavus]